MSNKVMDVLTGTGMSQKYNPFLPLVWQLASASVLCETLNGHWNRRVPERSSWQHYTLLLAEFPDWVGHYYFTQPLHSQSPLKPHILPLTSARSQGTSHGFFTGAEIDGGQGWGASAVWVSALHGEHPLSFSAGVLLIWKAESQEMSD